MNSNPFTQPATLGETLNRLRKTAKVSQVKFGEVVGLHQTAICRIEADEQRLTPDQLDIISKFFGLTIDYLMVGKVNFWNVAEKFGQEPPFQDRYLRNPFSKVREVLPAILFLNETKGHQYTMSLLASMGLGSLAFADPDQKIGVECTLNIVRSLIEKRLLNSKNFDQLIRQTRQPTIHGFLDHSYRVQESGLSLVQLLLLNSKHYESNFAYEIEVRKHSHMQVVVTPKEHMKKVPYRDSVLGDFLCQYKKQYLRNFPQYINSKALSLDEKECHFKGRSSHCVYEIRST